MHTQTEPGYRFDVFISYRHVENDRWWAKWLVRALETYKIPKELQKKGFPLSGQAGQNRKGKIEHG